MRNLKERCRRLASADLVSYAIILAAYLLLLMLVAGAQARAAGPPPFASGQVYDGQGQTVAQLVDLSGVHDTLVRNYKFTGGVRLAGNAHLSVQACDLTGAAGQDAMCNLVGVTSDCDITGCTFHDSGAYSGVYANNTNPVRLAIRNNVFRNVKEPVHLQWCNGPANKANPGDPHAAGYAQLNDCAVTGNVVTGAKDLALEFQGDVNGLEVANNWMDNWTAQAAEIAISGATGGTGQWKDYGWRVNIHDNAIGGNGLRGGGIDSNYSAIEAMGQDVRVVNNLVIGPWGNTVMYAWTSPAWTCAGNTFVGAVGLGNPRSAINSEPTNGVKPAAGFPGNQWLAAGARAMPAQPNSAAAAPPPSITPAVVTPTTNTQPAGPTVTGLSGAVTAKGTLTFAWQPIPGATYGYLLAAKGDASKVFGSGTLPAGASSVSASGVPDQWVVRLAISASGGPVATCDAQYFDVAVPATTQPSTRPATGPAAIVHTITTYGDGSIKVDGQ